MRVLVCIAAICCSASCFGVTRTDADRDAYGNSPLMLAVLHGHAQDVSRLLADKADPRHANLAGVTALHWAVDDVAKVRALVDAGADPNAADRNGVTPLALAAGRDDGAAVVEMLLAHGGDASKVGARLGGGDPQAIRVLLAKGADARKTTAIHLAAIRGSVDSLRALLDAGVDVNATNEQGLTPLMWAAQMGHPDAVAVLLSRGADPNIVEAFNHSTALMQAASSDRADRSIVQALVDAGADVHPVDDEGATALTWAIRRGDRDIIQIIAARESEVRPPRMWQPQGSRVGEANTPMAAMTRAIALLERARPKFRALSGCPSCHHDALPAMAIAHVAPLGIPIDRAARTAEARATAQSFRGLHERHLEGIGFADIVEAAYLLVGLAASDYPPDDITMGMARFLALRQAPDGGWHAWMQRIPVDGSDVTLTALAIRALSIYAPDAGRIARGRAYLATAAAQTTEDRVFQLLGLRWAGATAAEVADRIAELANHQRDDGGFAQRDAMRSDAYATGEAIVAMREAGEMPTTDARLQRAGRFLLAQQYTDGSWFVATRALRFQPWFDSGFPQGRSQYMSASATAWAVMALASLDDSGHH